MINLTPEYIIYAAVWFVWWGSWRYIFFNFNADDLKPIFYALTVGLIFLGFL